MSITWSEVQQRVVDVTVEVELAKHYPNTGKYAPVEFDGLLYLLRLLTGEQRALALRALGGEIKDVPHGQFWLELFDGSTFDVGQPTADQVHFTQIARGLARTHRYAGATEVPVTVLMHSLIAHEDAGTTAGADPRLPEYMLHHDDAEAIVSDLTYPVKPRPRRATSPPSRSTPTSRLAWTRGSTTGRARGRSSAASRRTRACRAMARA